MPNIITEDMIEQAAIELLVSEYAPLHTHINCQTDKPETLPDGTGRSDKKQVVLPEILFAKLCNLNPDIPEETVKRTTDELCLNQAIEMTIAFCVKQGIYLVWVA